ncbi:MAG: 3-phosphoserine/phosphohydroxythreonine transaminase [Saprospiraceae bacterium]|nr:MAG: 3-phosphoserine/phosphohydroxythreonine transaminase [Saprospiraceae bacterium]
MIATSTKKHNFSAGPAILPQSVFEEAAQAILDFNAHGLSILEISHRSKDFEAVMAETEALVREIGSIGERYAVLFLTGGASTQFFMAPMNFLKEGEKAAYVETGTWSSNAIKEARPFGDIEVVASSKERNFTFIPKDFDVPKNAAYLHLTSNNTIYGTQYQKYPASEMPLICDMSSDMFSRPFDIERFAMIYAGAQKNIGPAGVTLVIVRKDWMGRSGRAIPTMLNYKTHADKGSMYNTPPVFPIFVMMLTLRWIKATGGLAAINRRNVEKAKILYDEIDANPCFKGTVEKEDRSLMNVCFLPAKSEFEAPFLEMSAAAGITGIKGHRSAGGFRASIYNALGKESVQVLVEVMRAFAVKHG